MKHEFKEVANGLMVSLSGNVAKASFRLAIPAQIPDAAAKKVLSEASLYYDFNQKRAAVADQVEVPHAPSMLTDERYVFPNFRALSMSHLVSRGLDFTKPGVLEAAVPLLFGKTVYLNHEFTDVNDWVGVVAKSEWDAAGDKSGGVPGINVQCKVDAYLNYRIACGVMMTPPAINAMSLTIMFEFEYSHPELEKENRFWGLLGEEVEGSIVRLIVTDIIEIWEASFVFLGEDRLAKNHGGDATVEESFAAKLAAKAAEIIPPPNSNEEKTMNIPKEKRVELGIGFDGDDVPETEILKAAETLAAKVGELTQSTEAQAVAELQKQADAGKVLVEKLRAKVLADAKTVELGAEAGELPEVITDDIKAASVERLNQLETYYGDKLAKKFPKGGRSSEEESLAVEEAGGVNTASAVAGDDPTAGLL